MPLKPIGENQGERSINHNPENDMLVDFHGIRPIKYRKKSDPINGLSIESRFSAGFDLALHTLLYIALL